MNREELKVNPRLNEFTVQNLNTAPQLPFAGEAFDGAAICVSIQYLQRPVSFARSRARAEAKRAACHHVFQSLLSNQSRRRLAGAR